MRYMSLNFQDLIVNSKSEYVKITNPTKQTIKQNITKNI